MEKFKSILLSLLSIITDVLMYIFIVPLVIVILIAIFDIGIDALIVLCFIAPVYGLYELSEWLKRKI